MPEEPVTTIIKTDRLGRTHYSADYKTQVFQAFESSSLSGPAFAKQCGIKYSTFAAWVGKRKRKRKASADDRIKPITTFMVAEVPANLTSGTLKVTLPGGAIAEITAPQSPSSPPFSKPLPNNRHAHLQREPQSLRRARTL